MIAIFWAFPEAVGPFVAGRLQPGPVWGSSGESRFNTGTSMAWFGIAQIRRNDRASEIAANVKTALQFKKLIFVMCITSYRHHQIYRIRDSVRCAIATHRHPKLGTPSELLLGGRPGWLDRLGDNIGEFAPLRPSHQGFSFLGGIAQPAALYWDFVGCHGPSL
jgi:hypothetical protein